MKFFTFILLLFCLIQVKSQSISGTVTGVEGRKIYLQAYNGYLSSSIDSAIVSADSEFKMQFPEDAYFGLYRLLLENHPDPAQQRYVDLFFEGKNVDLNTSIEQPLYFINFKDELNKPFGETVKNIFSLHQRLDILENVLIYYPEGDFKEAAHNEQVIMSKKLEQVFNSFKKDNFGHPAIGYFDFRKSTDPFLVPFPDQEFDEEIFSIIDLSFPELARDPQPNRYFAAVFNHYYPAGAGRAEAIAFMEKYTDAVLNISSVNPALQDNIIDFLIKGYEQMGAFELVEKIYARIESGSCSDDSEGHIKKGQEKLKTVLPGSPAPSFTAKDINDKEINLITLKNKPVLMIFWSPDCSHCLNELPVWEQQLKQFKQKNVAIVGISLGNKKQWKQMSSKLPFEYNLLEESGWNSNLADKYNLVSTPTVYLLNKEHKIVGRYRHVQDAWLAFEKYNY